MEKNQQLFQLQACAAVCNICFEACLLEEHAPELSRCIRLTRDASEACLLAASFLARGSDATDRLLHLVAEITDLCAMECRLHDPEHCRRCAEVCSHTTTMFRMSHVPG